MLEQDNSFLHSAYPSISSNGIDDVLGWIKEQRERVFASIVPTKFSSLDEWFFNKETKNLQHKTGKFFSIDGLRVHTNKGPVFEWDQPIINQPEIGFLGIIAKEIRGTLHFLMQAKIEPGNINFVQLSPTLQATKSNFTRAHQGKSPPYLDFFLSNKKRTMADQLQSEQGGRFYKKRNRNIIIRVEEDVEVLDGYRWLSLFQLYELSRNDNVINMDTRTVLSGIPFGYNQGIIRKLGLNIERYPFLESLFHNSGLFSLDYILSWLTQLKMGYDVSVEKIPLDQVRDWIIGDESISHKDHRFFDVLPVSVRIDSREVCSWDQPMIRPAQEGLCAFLFKYINGIPHFLVQAKFECGNLDILELAPTVQCLTGDYRNPLFYKPPFLDDVLATPKERILLDVMQSEEGGRFYQEQNRNMIVRVPEDFPVSGLPENFIWMTLGQMKTFLKFNNYLNIQARSLISQIPLFYEQ